MKQSSKKQQKSEEIVTLIDDFCSNYLNKEYQILSHKIVEKLNKKRPSPLLRGKTNIWSASILYGLGQINFLFDKSKKPYISTDKLCNAFNANKGTVGGKAKNIRDLLDLHHFDSEFSISSVASSNPMRNVVYHNGIINFVQYENEEMKLTRLILEELPKFLPIKVKPTPDLVNQLRHKKFDLDPSKILSLKHIFYLGDEGGIVCDITPGDDPLISSLTQVEVLANEPMVEIIKKYQKVRGG